MYIYIRIYVTYIYTRRTLARVTATDEIEIHIGRDKVPLFYGKILRSPFSSTRRREMRKALRPLFRRLLVLLISNNANSCSPRQDWSFVSPHSRIGSARYPVSITRLCRKLFAESSIIVYRNLERVTTWNLRSLRIFDKCITFYNFSPRDWLTRLHQDYPETANN